ncbi:hypothetical protein [Nitrososphaera sp.]|uniref:hypothetical protein n=1 Tax=Nitrososphaera sp. TaxID=1971748 RepID=UPI00181FA409|nr:hypothetical protein [Nitrososphaera sp.]NWG36793.1 hypothetical protein [Nitrososphaera sp.]
MAGQAKHVHWPQRSQSQGFLWTNIALYSVLVVLSAVAVLSFQDAYAQPDSPASDSPRTFSRGISESLSVTSAFGSPSAPNHYTRTMSESVGITSSFPGQAQQTGISAGSPKNAQYTPGTNQRGDERAGLSFKNLGKRGDLVRTTTGGTQYQVLEAAVITTAARDFPEQLDSLESESDSDDSSYSQQLAWAEGYAAAQASAQNAAILGAGMYGTMLVGAFLVAAARLPVAANERRKVLVLVSKVRGVSGAQTSLIIVLAAVAAGSVALAADPSAGQAFADTDKAAIVYIEGSTPVYREWIPSPGGGGSWSGAVSLTSADSTLLTAKIEFSPVSSKRVIVTMDNTGRLDSYVCFSGCTDTANWTFTNNFADITTAASVTASYRPWDIEYEHTSGDLMIVYDYVESGSSATDDLFYRIMTDSQTAFGSESSINDTGNTATAGLYSFVAMDSQKISGSDEMALIAVDATNADASAIVWNGSNWTTLPQTELSTTVSIATEEAVAIAYETNSGDILVVAGEGTVVRHNTFSNASDTWGISSTSTGSWAVGTINWLRLVPDPGSSSDAIFLGGLGGSSDLDSAYWGGSTWTDHAEHDGGITNNDKRYFDMVWDGESSNVVIAWSTATNTIRFVRGDPSVSTFGGTTGVDSTFTVDNDGSVAQWIRLVSNPTTADTVAAMGLHVDGNADISGIRWDGGSNDPVSTGTDDITASSVSTTWEPFDIDFQKVPTKRSTADSFATADAITKLFNANRAASESLNVASAPARLAVLSRSAEESLAATDSLARMFSTSKSASETLNVADSPARVLHATRSASESLAITDSIARTVSLARSISSSLAVTDAPSRQKKLSRSASDALAVSDLAAYTRHITKSPSDSLGTADEIATTKALTKQLSDSLDVADSPDTTLAASRTMADTIAAADQASRTFSTSRSPSDSLSVIANLDTRKSLTKSIADSLDVSESAARTYGAARSSADSLSVTDSPAITSSHVRSVSDSLDLADALRGQPIALGVANSISIADDIAIAASKGTADSLSVSDAVAMRLMRTVSDSLSVSDAAAPSTSRPVSQDLAVSDNISFSVTRSLSDSVAVTDSAARSANVSKSISDSLDIGVAAGRSVARTIADSLLVSDSISALKTFGRLIGDSLAVSDSAGWTIIASRAVSDGVAVSDGIARTASVSQAAADSLSVADSVVAARANSRSMAESLAVSDSAAASQGFGRSLADSLAVAERIQPPVFDRVTITDSVSLSHARSLSDSLQAGDSIRASRQVTINDSLAVTSTMFVAWSGTLSLGESLALADGQCLPTSCIHNLSLGESLAMQDQWVPPPGMQEAIAIADSVAVSVVTAGPAAADSISVTDSVTTMLELVPPAVPAGWGLTEMPSVTLAGTGTSVAPPAAPALPGTYDASGGVAGIVQGTGMPDYDVDSSLAGADMTGQTMVIPMFRVSMNPSADLPARNGLLTPVVSSVPANTRVAIPVDIGATVGGGVTHPIDWMRLNYTPSVASTDFTLLVSMLDSQPAGAQPPASDTYRFYLDVRWTGTFAGAQRPSDSAFYAVRPTFTFAITEEWATQERMTRDANGVPMLSLSLLNEVTGQWAPAAAVDHPTASAGGLYVYTAHLDHFSTYAVTANTIPAGRGTGAPSEEEPGQPEAFAVQLADSLAVSDAIKAVPIEVIEEPGAREFAARIADSLAVLVQPAAVKTFTVGEKVGVTITVQSVERTSIVPPQVTATFLVDVVNGGERAESFELLFSYHDQSGKLAYSSSRLVEVGPLEKSRFTLDIPFDSPGTFQVSIEARSVPEGRLLSTSQQLVEVPWLEVNLYLVILAVVAVLGGSAAALLFFGPGYFAGRPGQQVFSFTSDNTGHGRAGKQGPVRDVSRKRGPEDRQSD